MIQELRKSGIIALPGITFNNAVYQGSLTGSKVIEAICSYILYPSDECLKVIKGYVP